MLQRARTLSTRRAIRSYREIRDRLRSDRSFRAFHEGRSAALPGFYIRRFESLMGRYASLLSPGERRPVFEEAGHGARRASSSQPVGGAPRSALAS